MKSIATQNLCGTFVAAAALLVITGCSASNSGLPPGFTSNAIGASTLAQAAKHHKRGEARITIRIPLKVKTGRRLHPEYISPSTKSMSVAVQGGATQTFNLTPTSSRCSESGSPKALTCQEAIVIPSGQQTLTVTLYDQIKGQGNQLATATTTVTIAATGFTPIPIVLGGVVSTVKALINNSSAATVPISTPTSLPVEVEAYDADNNLIVPPGNYSSPITLTNNDKTGTTSFAPLPSSAIKVHRLSAFGSRRLKPMDVTTVNAPGQLVRLYYDGGPLASPAAITPSVGGFTLGSGAATLTVTGTAVTVYPAASGTQPGNVVTGPDKALWFTDSIGNTIDRMTTDGSVTKYSIPTSNAGPEGIADGPDGALWFTENCPGKIGRVTTSGTFTEYVVPPYNGAASSGPFGITLGSDGALWFTENCGNGIGRITTAGSVEEFGVNLEVQQKDGVNYPAGVTDFLTEGPDGAVWFSTTLQELGRITTSGTITGYAIPSGNDTAAGVTAGSDGAIWFVEQGASEIGRMTTLGTVTAEYPTTTPNSLPIGIASGSDGALWFDEYYAHKIGRMTTNGAIVEYSVPSNANGVQATPVRITDGPDHAVWASDNAGNALDRVQEP